MPELPEVETVRQQLAGFLKDKPKITQVKTLRADLRFRFPDFKSVTNHKIEKMDRRAKYLLFDLGDQYLLSHLGMTGYWRFLQDEFLDKHDHLLLKLSDERTLVYNDPRRFGFVDLIEKKNFENSKWLHHLGPEPWDQLRFTADYLYSMGKKAQRPVKVFLMDQSVVVGVGNIYASEALFQAGISPLRLAKSLKLQDWQRLADCIPKILHQAVQSGGTTLRDYRNVYGESGGHQTELKVYGREAELCVTCSAPIKRKVLGGRSTFWCPKCQR